MSSVWEKVRDREKRRLEIQKRYEDIEVAEPTRVVLGPDPDRPRADWWYVYMMKKRLEWPKCEDRETVIGLFRSLWPRFAHRAEEFYDAAVALMAREG